jgi:uncharacterized protein (TIGR00369 family)
MSKVETPPGYEVSTMPDGPFAAMIGPLFIRLTECGPRFAFRAASKHTNARGVVHGGVLMSFADQTLGLTVQRAVGSIDVATVSLNCDLVTSAKPGDLIEGEATVTRIARRLIFVKGSLFCGDRAILNASGVWVRFKPAAGALDND